MATSPRYISAGSGQAFLMNEAGLSKQEWLLRMEKIAQESKSSSGAKVRYYNDLLLVLTSIYLAMDVKMRIIPGNEENS